MEVEALKKELAFEKEAHRQTKVKLKLRELENHSITKSASYKLAKIIAKPKHYAYKGYTIARTLYPGRIRKILTNIKHVERVYSSSPFLDAFKDKASSDKAVIIHLYYIDMLPFFVSKLQSLRHINYDLYITITDKNLDKLTYIIKELPNAKVAVVPNCGRDVLPFVQVMKQIKSKGYVSVLKLHSKKSPHRSDGDIWRDSIIDSLIPKNPEETNEIINVLNKKNTAIVGPTNEYVSMLVNVMATMHHVRKVVGIILSEQKAKSIVRHPDEYGFFAGTMFWARVDAIMPIIMAVEPHNFEPEFGQEDSTLAHAIERLFSVIPELQNKDLYELRDGKVNTVDYQTTNIPSWSDYAIDD